MSDAYDLVGDWYGVAGLDRVKLVDKLKQRISYRVTVKRLVSQGFQVTEQVEDDAGLHVTLRRVG
jgi:hypothetical protein